ncbi:MAG: fused protease/ribonucleoside-triphosphate reductase, partial [Candidatus Hydrogenedentota bacterium]
MDGLERAYLYAKSVTLVNTHWPETNAVMGKNRRIGVSQSGIIDAFGKHGIDTMKKWCNEGYKFLRKQDKKSSDWLTTPRCKKITTVKP